jgi:hypothetical protein
MWLRQIKWIILCRVPASTVRTWRSTLPRESFKAICFGEVSCPDIIVGPCTKKEGLGWKEEEEDDDSYHMSPEEYGDTTMEDNEKERGGNKEEQRASDEPADGLGRVISDAKQQCDTERERVKLEAMQKDHKKLLYPNCEDGSTKLGTILELLKWKTEAGLSDKGFEKLLKIMKPKLPKDNELPEITYEAKKTICPLGLDMEKIHACINDCILYCSEKCENMDKCPVCTACRYEIRQDDPSDVEGDDEPPRKRVPAKVMWYDPIIP